MATEQQTSVEQTVSMPAWLSEDGRGYWADLVRHLPPGRLTGADAHALGMLCNELATYVEADSLVSDAGILITGDHGELVPNPALPIRDRASAAYARWAGFLNITPSDRAGDENPRHGGKLPHRHE